MLTLYDFGNSVCCQKVRITLREKGLTWEAIRVDLFKAEQYDPKYLKLNPKGIVPTLVHDGRAIDRIDADLRISRRHLSGAARSFPPIRGCAPACGCGARWSTRGCSKASPNSASRPCSASACAPCRRTSARRRFRNIGDPRRRDRFMSTYEHGVRSPFVLHAIAAYERAFKLLEETLAETGPWILGDKPEPRRHQPDAVRGAARLSRAARSVDRRPAARPGLVGAGARMAALQDRAARSHQRSRVCRNAPAWPQHRRRRCPGDRRGARADERGGK